MTAVKAMTVTNGHTVSLNPAYGYPRFMLLSCRILTTSGFVDLFGMRSQIGSTSGPSRSPAPSHPQHHTKLDANQPRQLAVMVKKYKGDAP